MPVQSQAQNRFFHWAEAHPAEASREHGLRQSVVKEFIGGQKPGSVKALPERVAKPMKPRKPFGSFAP